MALHTRLAGVVPARLRRSAHADDDDADRDALPVPVGTATPTADPIEPRPYIEITPTKSPLSDRTVAQGMAVLVSVLREQSSAGLWRRLTRSTVVPTVEWLLVSDGHEDARVRYLVGVNPPELLADLDGILRTCFPNTYEFKPVEWHPRFLPAGLPVGTTVDPADLVTDPAEFTGVASATEPPYCAGVEYRGHAELPKDWQAPLTPFRAFVGGARRRSGASPTYTDRPTGAVTRRLPLSAVTEAVADEDVAVAVQVVCEVFGDWTGSAAAYLADLEDGTVTLGDKAWDFFVTDDDPASRDRRIHPQDRERIDGIRERDPKRSLRVSARAVALTRDAPATADRVARRLQGVFEPLSGPAHEVRGHVVTDDDLHPGFTPPGTRLFEDVVDRTCHPATYGSWRNRLPWRSATSRGLVVDPVELPGFCLLGGAELTPTGERALRTRARERTGLPLPPAEQLRRFGPPGQAIGMPLTHDRLPTGTPFVLPASVQDKHLIVAGASGAGKSVLMHGAMLTNAVATDGPQIYFDYKGEGAGRNYLEAHYATYGTLENVRYFSLPEYLPAFTPFDIGPLLEAGLPLEEARSRTIGQYEELLAGLMPEGKYEEAVESTKAIRNHLRALYDPVHGSTAPTHEDLHDALTATDEDRSPPPVSSDRLEKYFRSLVNREEKTFKRIIGGAIGRVDTISTDDRIAPVFDYDPDPETDRAIGTDADRQRDGGGDEDRDANGNAGEDATAEDDWAGIPRFDFTELIDEDCIVIFDFGGMEDGVKRALTLVILYDLWKALKARAERPDAPDEPPLVNLYLEEAGQVAETSLVDTLLSQGRSFRLSLALDLQFPEQLDSTESWTNTYRESLNEVGNVVAGRVTVDTYLPRVFETDELPRTAVERRLSNMPAGEWLVRAVSTFGDETLRPFLARSLPAPRGHPASDDSLTPAEERRFEAAFERVRDRTIERYGIHHNPPDGTDTDTDATDDRTGSESDPGGAADHGAEGAVDPSALARVDTLLSHTKRLPAAVTYDGEINGIRCARCRNRYDPTLVGLRRGVECCGSLDDVDRDDIPTVESHLKLSPRERRDSGWSDTALLFLQVVHNALQGRYDESEYDIKWDSMLRLQEYAGIEDDEVAQLLSAGVLRHDSEHPHRLYSIPTAGRDVIGEAYREGLDFGHGKGDLDESAQHVLGIAVGAYMFAEAYIPDPDSAVVEYVPYFEVGDGKRLDLAGLDADGNVVVAVEVERINHDHREAVPRDYDKMAACEPEEAIWIVMRGSDAHTVLEALNEPPDGEPRVEKTYAKTTPPQQFTLDAPGCTAIHPVVWLRDRIAKGEFRPGA